MTSSACTGCGACCAAYAVDFHASEVAGAGRGGVPPHMTVPVVRATVRMRGTDAAPARCVALGGQVGARVACTIYDHRPGPCREFEAGTDACNRARLRHGLAALA